VPGGASNASVARPCGTKDVASGSTGSRRWRIAFAQKRALLRKCAQFCARGKCNAEHGLTSFPCIHARFFARAQKKNAFVARETISAGVRASDASCLERASDDRRRACPVAARFSWRRKREEFHAIARIRARGESAPTGPQAFEKRGRVRRWDVIFRITIPTEKEYLSKVPRIGPHASRPLPRP